jgi:hypothetical protein
VIRSFPLDPQPTARQTREILFHIGHELSAIGAHVDHSLIGGFRFRMPPFWKMRRLRFLLPVSSGRVTIGADSGEPWRVRYELKFTALLTLVIALSALLIVLGLHWTHGRLLDVLIGLWAIIYAIPYAAADAQFRRWLVATCAAAPVTRIERPRSL